MRGWNLEEIFMKTWHAMFNSKNLLFNTQSRRITCQHFSENNDKIVTVCRNGNDFGLAIQLSNLITDSPIR